LAATPFAGINGAVLPLPIRASKQGSDDQQSVLRGFIWVAAFVVILSALTRSVNHDESQYVAAVALMRQGLPYRDFAYLQTPLQPLLFSPLAYLPAGWTLIGSRAANAALGFITIVLLAVTLRGRASQKATLVAVAALLCTDAFLLASSLARNDALAMMLLAAALPPLLLATETKSARMFALGGLALGLAVSAKISAALPAAGAVLFILWRGRHYGSSSLLALVAGLLFGLVPALVMALLAPGPFLFDVFAYNLEAPVQWWSSISAAAELEPLRRAVKLLGFASQGSILVALISIPIDQNSTEDRLILNFMIVAGLVASFLPKPALVQYMVPLLPPLFARFALALDSAPAVSRKALLILTGVGSIAGLVSGLVVRFDGLELFRSVHSGRQVALLAKNGPVVTLSSEFVAGDGVLLDPRFAAGPFLYRTHGQLARAAQAEGRAVTAESVNDALTLHPPAVVVVGAEGNSFPPIFPEGLDQPLITWSENHHYRPVQLGGGLVALVRGL
jgi:4-amino-4-deoxy-L-arabinose transferase-like glycosyltransferase